MGSKSQIYILVATALLVLVVYLATSVNIDINITSKNNQNNAQVQGQAISNSDDSMADHHKPKPVDSANFDNLLGKAAPDFTLPSYDGKKYSLSELKGKNVILFFNEGLMCYPACWNQVAAFGSDKELKASAVVLNINVDPKEEWKKAVDKMPELSAATVLLDTDRSVSQTYGVLTLTSSMHRGQFPGHTYVIVDKDGIVRLTKDDESMAVRNKELAMEINKL